MKVYNIKIKFKLKNKIFNSDLKNKYLVVSFITSLKVMLSMQF